MFWRQVRATGQLRTVFPTSLSFLLLRANLKQNDSCAVWFGSNFEQQHGCAHSFYKFYLKQQIKFLGYYWPHAPIQVNLQMACSLLHNFNVFRILVTKGAYFNETQSCAGCFDANFKQKHTCAECFAQVLWKTTFQSFRQVFDLKSKFRQNYSCLTVFHNL